MKLARISLWLAVALLALLAWRYWPTASAPITNAAPTANVPSTKVVDNQLPPRAVEAPTATPAPPGEATPPTSLPTVMNTMNATVLEANRQETLDGLLKFQTTLEQTLGTTTDPRDRDALEHELSQLQLQIQYEIGSSPATGMVETDLGKITLDEHQPTQTRLASGDEATLTAATSADGNWSVNISVQHTDADGRSSVETALTVVQRGQPAIIKISGNEIHFTPQAAGSNSSN